MKHVVVGSSSDLIQDQVEAAVINNKITGSGLFSLIDGLKGDNIGAESIGKTANRVADYYNSISGPAHADLYVDSGGYSFIRGDLAPGKLDQAISLYHSYARLHSSDFDFIFSLDIPLSQKFNEFNTKQNVYEYNRKSLKKTAQALRDQPSLVEKLFFIYHFKTLDHYEIWKHLERELAIKDIIKYKAIGGMVSIKTVAQISIAPFIATAFQSLWDYKTSRFNGEDFRLHLLGISVAYDRFVIAYLEKLFQHYLGPKTPVHLTYDSVKFRRAAMYKQNFICEFDGETLHHHDPLDIPEHQFNAIYKGRLYLIDEIKKDLHRKAMRQQHQNMALLAPLTIASELAIDRFFEHVIDRHNLIEMLVDTKNIMHFKYDLRETLSLAFAECKNVFGRNMLDSIMDSMVHVYKFHRWYTRQHDEESLDDLTRDFIRKAINYPFALM